MNILSSLFASLSATLAEPVEARDPGQAVEDLEGPDPAQLSALKTAVGLMALTAVSFLVTGYRYGIDDHIVHIPRLLEILNPGTYSSDDPFLQAQATHYSFFWYGVAPLARLLPLPALFLLLTFAFRFLTAVALWRLSYGLFRHTGAAWLGAGALLADKLTFGFYIQPDRALLDRSLALPLVLFALERFLAGRRYAPFALLGLVANIHVLSSVYALPMLLSGTVWRDRKSAPASLAAGSGLFLLAAAPIALWRLQQPGDLPLVVPDQQWLAIAKAAILTLLNLTVPDVPHVIAWISGFSFVCAWFIAKRHAPAADGHGIVAVWIATAGALVAAAVLFTDVWPVSLVLQVQLVRAAQWLVILPVLYLAYLLWSLKARARLSGLGLGGAGAALVLSLFGFLPLLALVPAYLPRAGAWWLRGGVQAGAQVGALALAALYLIAKFQAWPFVVSPPDNDWSGAAAWVREHTPQGATVLVPPYARGAELGSEFRVVAGRSTVATYAEGGEAGFNRAFALSWYERMRDLTGGGFSLERPHENSVERMREQFDALPNDRLWELARRYGASYLVLTRDRPAAIEPVFTNGTYAIYPALSIAATAAR